MERGSFQLMKSVNKSLVLNKIRTSEPISRAQIAKETKLTPPTVSSIVKELLEDGLVRESELGESSGGRKPKMLHINSDAFYVIGVDAGPETVDCVLTDLTGKIVRRSSSYVLTKPLTNDKFLGILQEIIGAMIHSTDVVQEKIIGIGIAMHGVVEVKTGTSLVAPNLDLKHIPIKATLEGVFDLTVKVENDARAMALGESWFGGNSDVDSMVAVNFGSGVGAGVVIHGNLYHGAQDIAGEFGHMTIDLHGEKCECGNPGCLQTFVSGEALAERFNKQVNQNKVVNGEEIYKMAKTGDVSAVQFLQETGEIIGIGLTNLIHLVNPSRIVLGGGVMKSQEFILPEVYKMIEQRALTTEAKKTEVIVSRLGDDATLLGAVSLLLVELFEH
ncbi:ROK family transcriptional regulator [Oceanobacillus piezotolerans]|uniref:ROK family transcriptional regulator n=1 Tax=Oceanobacillus piezotolerans TaxID=2448030 RepID=A0A498D9G9_9BACI|nr:ROK family transcriptional regulator [Oceanobacillus piezotolerans]RLL43837.1 ROK family transcriptional regulator [Oceanobacillus piezotolerans]